MNIFSRINSWSDSRGISCQAPSENDWEFVRQDLYDLHEHFSNSGVSGYVLNVIEELTEYAHAKASNDENGVIDAIADNIIFANTELLKEKYEPQLVANEVLMVVESRTGSWCDTQGKFIKDKSPDAQARWYEPNYVGKCKRVVNKTKSLFGFDRCN